jgi:hypothetical protein
MTESRFQWRVNCFSFSFSKRWGYLHLETVLLLVQLLRVMNFRVFRGESIVGTIHIPHCQCVAEITSNSLLPQIFNCLLVWLDSHTTRSSPFSLDVWLLLIMGTEFWVQGICWGQVIIEDLDPCHGCTHASVPRNQMAVNQIPVEACPWPWSLNRSGSFYSSVVNTGWSNLSLKPYPKC